MYLISSNPVMVHPDIFSKLGEWIGEQIQGWMEGFLDDSIGLISKIISKDAGNSYYNANNYSAFSFENVANRDVPVEQAIIPGMNYFFLIFQTIGWIFLACLFITQLYRTFFSSMTGSSKASPTNAFGRLILAGVMMVLAPQIIDWMCQFGDKLMHWVSYSMRNSLGITDFSDVSVSWSQDSFGGVIMSCIFCGVLAYNIFMAYLNQVERFVVFGITVQLFPLASAMFGTQEHEDSARNYYLMLFSQMFAILMNNILFVLLIYKLNHMGDDSYVGWIIAIAICSIAKSSERLLNALGIHAMPTPESARNFASGVIGVGSMASAGFGMATAGIRAGASMVGGARNRLFGNAGATARSSGSAGGVGGAVKGLANGSNHVLSPKESAIKSLAKMGTDGKLTRGDMNKALMENGFISGNTTALGRAMARGVQSLPGGAIYQAKKEIGTRAAMASAVAKGTTGVIAGTNSATAAKIMGLSGKTASGAAFGFNTSAIKRNADGSFTLSGTAVKNGNTVSSSMRVMPSSKQMADITGLSSAMPKVSWSSADAVKTNAAGNVVLTGTTMRNLKTGGQSAYEGKYELGNKADILRDNPLRNYVPISEDGNYVASMIKGNPALINDIEKTNNNILAKGTQTSGDIVNSAFETSYTMDGFKADHACKVNYGDNNENSAILMAGTMPTNDQSDINQMYAIFHGDNPDFDEFQKQTQYSVNPGTFYDLGDGNRAYHVEAVELDPSKNEAEIKLQKETRAMLYSEDASSAAEGGYYNQADDRVNDVLDQKEREINERENESNKHDGE